MAPVAPEPAPPPREPSESLALLFLALRVLSQRSVQLAGHLLPLFALGTGFALWWRVLPSPTFEQLAGLAIYAAFMLLMLLVRAR